jgi:hypothetical protein
MAETERLSPRAFDAEIERQYPLIPWREPIVIRSTAVGGLACRLCIARIGFSPLRDRERLFQTLQQFAEHMKETHGPQQHED